LKIIIVGDSAKSSLELSYFRAMESLNIQVTHFDPNVNLKKHIKFGIFGRKINTYIPLESWIKKMNRDFIVEVKEIDPDVIFLFTTARILYGTLATIKIISKAKIVWIWPDTPMNLAIHNLQCSKLYDYTASYSKESISIFNKLGFNNPVWVPLAADSFLHYKEINNDEFNTDISFVGMWRPERERILSSILIYFPELSIEIYGKNWKKNCSNRNIIKKWKGEGIYGAELGNYFNKSRINLNIIDDTNFPAANMRFFEILISGGLQLCSPCPEMSDVFIENEHILYFTTENDLVKKIKWIIANPKIVKDTRRIGQKVTVNQHTYLKRVQKILETL